MQFSTPVDGIRLYGMDAKLASLENETLSDEASKWISAWDQKLPSNLTWETSGPYAGASFDEAFEKDFETKEWRPIKLPTDQAVNSIFGKENSALYFRTSIKMQKAGTFNLRLGSDDGTKVWLNKKLVHNNKINRPLKVGEDTVKLDLVEGDNALLIKVANGVGEGGVSVGLGDALQPRIEAATTILAKATRARAETREILRP